MNLTTPFKIGIKGQQEGVTDAHGNPVVTYTDPILVDVHSIAPASTNEPDEDGRNVVVTHLKILAPIEVKSKVSPDSIIVIDGEDYTVEGEIADWTRNPFGWQAGIEITVKRVEG